MQNYRENILPSIRQLGGLLITKIPIWHFKCKLASRLAFVGEFSSILFHNKWLSDNMIRPPATKKIFLYGLFQAPENYFDVHVLCHLRRFIMLWMWKISAYESGELCLLMLKKIFNGYCAWVFHIRSVGGRINVYLLSELLVFWLEATCGFYICWFNTSIHLFIATSTTVWELYLILHLSQ